MSYKRSIDELDFDQSAASVAKRKVDGQSQECEPEHSCRRHGADQSDSGHERQSRVEPMESESDSESDAEETEPDMIMPYLDRFQESYESSLEIYSSRLAKLELSDALKCTNDLFAVAIDNYAKEHIGFAHTITRDLSGVENVRREFCQLVRRQLPHTDPTVHALSDAKLAKVLAHMLAIETKICADMSTIYESYEQLLVALVSIEYRLSVVIAMFHHMTEVEPLQFLPQLPYMQNVPDLIGYVNSLYDQTGPQRQRDTELTLRDETNNQVMQAIVNQFRAMHRRIRDAMDGLHALSCIIMEKKTEVIDRVHTFYKKAEQIFFAEPSFMFQSKDKSQSHSRQLYPMLMAR